MSITNRYNTRSKNFITHIPATEESSHILHNLRVAFAKKGIAIKWYRNKDTYSIYFRQQAERKVKKASISLDTPAFDYVESQFTPEQIERAFA